MTEGFTQYHWAFVTAAYIVTVLGLGGLTLYLFARLRHWAKLARALDEPN